MLRQKFIPFLEWDAGLLLKVAPRLAVLSLFAFAVLLLVTADADARRRYYRHRVYDYSPPASAMALDLYSGRVLYSKNVHDLRYPASLTKVMTLYLLFDALRDGKLGMNTQLRVSAHAADQSPTKLDLSEGDKISVADAIGAIVTKSANDMAVTVAEALAGSEEEFARRMTQKARSIGMLHTTFRNASGLPNSEQQTTAYDLIILGKSILADHPERSKVFATRYFQYDGQVFRNHNTLLYTYEGMEGMKTGFTQASGFNLIATARRSDKRLLAVVLGGASSGARNAAMRNILDNSWSKAMTQMAARKAGVLMASVARPDPEPEKKAASPKAAEREEPKPVKTAVVAVKPAPLPVPAPAPAPATEQARLTPAFPGAYSRLKRRPDQASLAMLFHSIEAGLVARPSLVSYPQPPVSSDTTTDEPEDKAALEDSHNPSYAPPPANEIVRNETIAAMTQPATQNLSVHNKSVRQPEVTPLAAAALDLPAAEPAPVKIAQAVPVRQVVEEAPQTTPVREVKQEVPQTLAAAAPEPERPAQPGPFHIQAGAFTDEAQAKERLEDVREALGADIVKAHPEFIMRITLPNGTTMYRARLGRFANEAQATVACKRLKKSGIECYGMPVD
jgi:D-alanyl-D-alanine carboxypeptidase